MHLLKDKVKHHLNPGSVLIFYINVFEICLI